MRQQNQTVGSVTNIWGCQLLIFLSSSSRSFPYKLFCLTGLDFVVLQINCGINSATTIYDKVHRCQNTALLYKLTTRWFHFCKYFDIPFGNPPLPIFFLTITLGRKLENGTVFRKKKTAQSAMNSALTVVFILTCGVL